MKNEKGQTLLLALFCMVILFVAAVFLFDLQNIMRAKLKGRSAVDAAALVGANWQRHSLNLIGDLNLVKASTVMLSDVVGNQKLITIKDANNLLEKSSLFTELQTRVSFVGPLIGFGAMQQAGKANGLPANKVFSTVVEDHLNKLLDDPLYQAPHTSETINRYPWRYDYIAMVDQIWNGSYGTAVGTNVQFISMPKLMTNSNIGVYLTNKQIYRDILADNWCGLRGLLRCDFSSSQWWGSFTLDDENGVFIGQSEYIPLYLTAVYACQTCKDQPCTHFSKRYSSPKISGNKTLDRFLDERNLQIINTNQDNADPDQKDNNVDPYYDPLRRLSFLCYDDKWQSYSEEKVEMWNRYMRSDIRPENRFSGALSYAVTRIELVGKSNLFVPPSNIIPNAPQMPEYHANENPFLEPLEITSIAKPIGYLPGENQKLPPHSAARLVLPCFDRSVLIPTSLEPIEVDVFDYVWYCFLTEYLPALAECSSITEMNADKLPIPSHWEWFASYHTALQKLDDASWRTAGITWLDTPIAFDENNDALGTNEDTCDDIETGTTGGEGPPSLH